jgi:C-terminal processing protease CtpA/Prc
MKKLILIAWVLVAFISDRPALSEELGNVNVDQALRVERLAATAKVWSVIKFFHPYPGYRDIDWDGALVQAIPKINTAKDDAEFASAIKSMIDVLNDPLTRIELSPQERNIKPASEQYKLTDEKILIVAFPPSSNFEAANGQLQKVAEDLPKAKAIIFDFRSAPMFVSYAFGKSNLARRLTSTAIKGPAVRTRFHSGYANPDHWGSGGYFSAFATSDASILKPEAESKDVPVVILTNRQGGIPQEALWLWGAGKAKLIVEGSLSEDMFVPSTMIELPKEIEVRVRLGELVFDDGTTGLVPDATAAENEGMDVALSFARDATKAPTGVRPRCPAVAVPRVDSAYADMTYPAAEYRVLAAIRIWSVHKYFYAYKDLIGEDWDAVLKEFIPKMEAARDAKEYNWAVKEMVAHVHDTHAFTSSPALRDSFGASPPIVLRWIEESPVVTRLIDEKIAKEASIERGDVILKIDGETAKTRADWWLKYIAASTRQSQMAQVAFSLLMGPEGTVTATVRDRNGDDKEVKLPRTRKNTMLMGMKRKGDITKMLPGNVGYVDLDRLSMPMVDAMFENFKDAKAIIFDMRGYPLGTAWAIAPRLTEKKNVVAARFERPLAMFSYNADWMDQSAKQIFYQTLPPNDKSMYKGKTVMLIDERAVSSAEHTGLFFEAANGTKFVGSPTTGANGDITYFFVPGGIKVSMTGHNVSHADGRQLQRLGLTPDVEAKPTIEGIRQGRDEVLEKALDYLGVKLTEPLKGVGEAL